MKPLASPPKPWALAIVGALIAFAVVAGAAEPPDLELGDDFAALADEAPDASPAASPHPAATLTASPGFRWDPSGDGGPPHGLIPLQVRGVAPTVTCSVVGLPAEVHDAASSVVTRTFFVARNAPDGAVRDVFLRYSGDAAEGRGWVATTWSTAQAPATTLLPHGQVQDALLHGVEACSEIRISVGALPLRPGHVCCDHDLPACAEANAKAELDLNNASDPVDAEVSATVGVGPVGATLEVGT